MQEFSLIISNFASKLHPSEISKAIIGIVAPRGEDREVAVIAGFVPMMVITDGKSFTPSMQTSLNAVAGELLIKTSDLTPIEVAQISMVLDERCRLLERAVGIMRSLDTRTTWPLPSIDPRRSALDVRDVFFTMAMCQRSFMTLAVLDLCNESDGESSGYISARVEDMRDVFRPSEFAFALASMTSASIEFEQIDKIHDENYPDENNQPLSSVVERSYNLMLDASTSGDMRVALPTVTATMNGDYCEAMKLANSLPVPIGRDGEIDLLKITSIMSSAGVVPRDLGSSRDLGERVGKVFLFRRIAPGEIVAGERVDVSGLVDTVRWMADEHPEPTSATFGRFMAQMQDIIYRSGWHSAIQRKPWDMDHRLMGAAIVERTAALLALSRVGDETYEDVDTDSPTHARTLKTCDGVRRLASPFGIKIADIMLARLHVEDQQLRAYNRMGLELLKEQSEGIKDRDTMRQIARSISDTISDTIDTKPEEAFVFNLMTRMIKALAFAPFGRISSIDGPQDDSKPKLN